MIKVDGALLKEDPKEKGVNPSTISRRYLRNRQLFSNIENKNMSPGINILSALCKKLNVETPIY